MVSVEWQEISYTEHLLCARHHAKVCYLEPNNLAGQMLFAFCMDEEPQVQGS